MKIRRIAFLYILSVVCLTGVNAQETVSKPLRLTLRIREKELCVGQPFTITARLENISETEQIIDKKSVWRSVFLLGTLENNAPDEKSSKTGNGSETFQFQRATSYALLFKSEQRHLLSLKPKEFFEDDKIITADDKYFNLTHVDLPGTYLFFGGFFQNLGESSNNPKFFEGSITSEALKFTMKDCK